jgi:membrane protein DedA with SNARE-associated domain
LKLTITELIQTLLEIDQYLPLITQFGLWVYLILFVIVFLETGFVLMSIFPGDSLLFVAGALAAVGTLELGWLLVLALAATLLADSFNYVVGGQAGRRVLVGRLPFTQARHMDRTERYLARSGRSAIVMARFIPCRHVDHALSSLPALQHSRRVGLGQLLRPGRLLLRQPAHYARPSSSIWPSRPV